MRVYNIYQIVRFIFENVLSMCLCESYIEMFRIKSFKNIRLSIVISLIRVDHYGFFLQCPLKLSAKGAMNSYN